MPMNSSTQGAAHDEVASCQARLTAATREYEMALAKFDADATTKPGLIRSEGVLADARRDLGRAERNLARVEADIAAAADSAAEAAKAAARSRLTRARVASDLEPIAAHLHEAMRTIALACDAWSRAKAEFDADVRLVHGDAKSGEVYAKIVARQEHAGLWVEMPIKRHADGLAAIAADIQSVVQTAKIAATARAAATSAPKAADDSTTVARDGADLK